MAREGQMIIETPLEAGTLLIPEITTYSEGPNHTFAQNLCVPKNHSRFLFHAQGNRKVFLRRQDMLQGLAGKTAGGFVQKIPGRAQMIVRDSLFLVLF
jgi:hypothetical protein